MGATLILKYNKLNSPPQNLIYHRNQSFQSDIYIAQQVDNSAY